MTRLYLMIAALVLGLALAVGGTWRHVTKKYEGTVATLTAERNDARMQLAEAAKQRAHDAKVIRDLYAARGMLAREAALLRTRLSAALEANPEWSAQPVPKEVQDALAQP